MKVGEVGRRREVFVLGRMGGKMAKAKSAELQPLNLHCHVTQGGKTDLTSSEPLEPREHARTNGSWRGIPDSKPLKPRSQM